MLLSLCSFIINTDIVFSLGKDNCVLKQHRKPGAVATLVNLHDNENTAIEAYQSLPDNLNLNLLEIEQAGNRLLKYKWGNKAYSFDPNRIFSKTAISKTLAANNKTYPTQLADKVNQFAEELLKQFTGNNKEKYLIALHNNTDGNFSISTYQGSDNTGKIFINKNLDPDDFFIVTLEQDFEKLRSENQNVVLQSINAEDDGSLSVYCQKNGIPFINIEAQHSHREPQAKMIQLVYNLLLKN